MCPSWNRVADEIEAIASDRVLAASGEPDPRERELLAREGLLLQSAADAARGGPADGWLVHAACEGVVVQCDRLVIWGMADTAEGDLRRLAIDATTARRSHEPPDPCEVLRVVLGLPPQAVRAEASDGLPRTPHRPAPLRAA